MIYLATSAKFLKLKLPVGMETITVKQIGLFIYLQIQVPIESCSHKNQVF